MDPWRPDRTLPGPETLLLSTWLVVFAMMVLSLDFLERSPSPDTTLNKMKKVGRDIDQRLHDTTLATQPIRAPRQSVIAPFQHETIVELDVGILLRQRSRRNWPE